MNPEYLKGLAICDCNGACYCANGWFAQQFPEPYIEPLEPFNALNEPLFDEIPVTDNQRNQQRVFITQNDYTDECAETPAEIHDFIHNVEARSPPRRFTGSANQELASPYNIIETDLLSPYEQHNGGASDSGRRRRNRSRASSQSSRTPDDPDCRYAPDFVSVSGSQRSADSSLPPVFLKGSRECYEDILKWLHNHVKRTDIDTNRNLPFAVPGLAAMAASSESLYKGAGGASMSEWTLRGVLDSPEYRNLVCDILAGRAHFEPIPHNQLSLEDFGFDPFNGYQRYDITSEFVLAAVLKAHDVLHMGSHSLGVVYETGSQHKRTPIFDVRVVKILQDSSPSAEEPDIIWIFRGMDDHSRTTANRWSSLSSNRSSESEIICGPDCYKTYFHRKALENHQRQVHNEDLLPCTIDGCEDVLKGKRGLARHLKTVHGSTEVFTCDDCNHIFNRKDNLKRHKRTKNGQCAREA